MNQPAIEITGLGKRYGPISAIDDLSLTVGTGEVFGVLGPNGAGKTTTVEILEGYRAPDAGTVRVLGLDPTREGADLRPRIGVMLQEGGLYPGITPREALALFATYYPSPRDPGALLERVGLLDAAGTLVRRMSGGQQQRLSLALALVGNPELVFLDEPTAGMDPRARLTTFELIEEMRARGVTVLLTTHAMDEAEQLCDRVAIVDHGRLVALGSPSELTMGARDETWFSAKPELPLADLAAAVGVAATELREERPGEYVIGVPASPTLIADLAIWLRERDVALDELRAGRRSLEEVFLRLTSEAD
jgi:ABC-2 type transport system ATP-binding protein